MVKKILSVLLSMMIILSCMGTVVFASETEIFSVKSLEQYVVASGEIANDGYIGIPVGVKTYVKDKSAATDDTPHIMYVVNTNTVRYGTDSDETILTDMLEKGYVVTVLDYYGNEKAKTPDLEWSIQVLKTKLRTNANYRSTYLAGTACSATYVYSLPAGYNLTRQINYWSIDRHGSAGSLDFIVSVWNSDFLGVWGNKGVITYADGSTQTVREYTESLPEGKVTDISQCIKRDGNIIDFNLYMDIIYPTHPEKEVPEAPYVYGYKFNGWYADGKKAELEAGEVVTDEVNTEYVAGFIKDSASYKVTVNGNEETHAYNEKVTYTAEAEKDGKTFSYWKRDGVAVCYNAEYSFYVNGDTTLEAVYGENVSGGVVLAMANPVLVDGTKIAFFAERDIPADCTVIETGILMGTAKGITLETADIKATAKSMANKGQYTVRKANVKTGETYYSVAYAIYRDAEGNVLYAYSNEVSYTVK